MNYLTALYTIENNIKTICIAADSVPEGIHNAHEKLHAFFPDKTGRKFYGIAHGNVQGGIVYYAATNEIFEGEAQSLNCPSFSIKKGNYNTILIKDYYKDIPSVGRAFDFLLKDARLEPDGYCLEMYPTPHNSKDIICCVKIL